ncbi:hypothetical protein [Mycobacteroides abscessus]|uniref:hypothetical protein n=1 Tax=Mycobacteroides abscessus TaxID=36809 RepID=UPI001F25C905|nr:hypothetical protein [Mycobacteroides abscessus]
MIISQSRSGATILVSMAVALGVGMSMVGCTSVHPTTGASTISTSAAHELVDVFAVWASHPMPPCPRVVIGNHSAPVGLELPSDETVAAQFQGVKSPGSESWVRAKLGWVTKWLAKVRADIVDANTPGDSSMTEGFNDYVRHVRAELEAGQDITDSALDGDYPEGCA